MSNIIQTAEKAGTFTTLLAAVKAAGMDPTLEGKGPFTVFAPNDEAFAKLPKGTVESLLTDIPKLKKILSNHVVSGNMSTADVRKRHDLKTVDGGALMVHANGGVKINESNVLGADINTDNGVIHVIDAVLLPKN